MSETVFQKIVALLEKENIKFSICEHEPVFTSEQAAQIRGSSLKQGAKALVFYADKKPIMIVIAGDRKVDSKKVKSFYGIHDLRLASSDEIEELLEGVKVGAVPPFGDLFNLPVYVDQSLGENKEIVFNAGLHTKSIKMSYQDWFDLVKPTLGDFAI